MTMCKIMVMLCERYYRLAYQIEDGDKCFRLISMINYMVTNMKTWPEDKMNRWMGFIQGVLFAEGLIDIDEEREFTRPLFHKYYEDYGIEVPASIDVTFPLDDQCG